jgi:ketosteroid isomerase-like protein
VSEHDVELVRRSFAEFNAGMDEGNPARAFDVGVTAPTFRWTLPPDAPGMKRAYEGRDGWLEFIQTWTEDFEWTIEIEEIVDVGDGRVVVNTIQKAIGKASGVPVELRMGAIWHVKDGQIAGADNYLERDQAFKAAGIER